MQYSGRGADGVRLTRRNERQAPEPEPRAPARRGASSARFRAGFTLIELLVVIAIIAVLAALLVPAMKRSLAIARRVACVSNMHQFGVAIHGYTSTANGMMPPIWQRGFMGTPDRNLAGRGRGFTMFGVLMQTDLLPSQLFRCPADPRDFEVREEAFYMPFYQRGEDYSQPHEHVYSYGAVNVGYLRSDRRVAWSMPNTNVLGGFPPHPGQIGTDFIPNPTILHLVWDAHIPLFNSNNGTTSLTGGWPNGWGHPGFGGPEETVFRHALNDWEDWTQGPCSLLADGHAESWVDWEAMRVDPNIEDYFSIPMSP